MSDLPIYIINSSKFAEEIAEKYNLTICETPIFPTIAVSDNGTLTLLDNQTRKSILGVDFCGGELLHRIKFGGNRSSLLAKAIGAKSKSNAPKVIDATAGLGRDAFVLASLGCEVTMLERSRLLFIMLDRAISVAKENPLTSEIASRMKLHQQDSIEYLSSHSELSNIADVIYLDPMFPHEKRKAQIKQEMITCREVVGDDLDAAELFEAASKVAIPRIVVKRMKSAPFISSATPSQQFIGKTNRFDLYLREKSK